MSDITPNYLKLHVESSDATDNVGQHEFGQLNLLCRSFENATGWPLRCEVKDNDTGLASASEFTGRRISLDRSSSGGQVAVAAEQGVEQLADVINDLVEEIQLTKEALWKREAELAAGVPVVRHSDEETHLALRLEAVLQCGAKTIDCKAAALYMLDETTSHLKLRASWGLPRRRLVDTARPLKGATADLEALVGHAVVLKDTSVLEHWNAPEDYPAAVCVPVSTPTTVLGTLWFFAESARDFSEKQSTTAEIVAGRLAADLEREMLMLESVQHKKWERDFSHLVEQQQRRLPNITPVMDNWQVANWYHPADDATGEFYDWFVLPDSRFGVVVGKANGDGLESVLTAMTLQSAIKSHSVYAHSCDQMLNRVSETLWSSSQGDQFASMFYTLIDPEEGRLEYSGAGRVGAVICRSGTPEILRVEPSSLGEDIDVEYASFQASLVPGDVLVLFTDGLRDALETPENVTAEEKIASVLAAQNNASAEAIIDRIQDLVETYASARALTDRTAIVIRRD